MSRELQLRYSFVVAGVVFSSTHEHFQQPFQVKMTWLTIRKVSPIFGIKSVFGSRKVVHTVKRTLAGHCSHYQHVCPFKVHSRQKWYFPELNNPESDSFERWRIRKLFTDYIIHFGSCVLNLSFFPKRFFVSCFILYCSPLEYFFHFTFVQFSFLFVFKPIT